MVAGAVAVWSAAGAPARAQAPGPEPSSATIAEATAPANGVISYSPADFAQFQPANAFDMIGRIPGFSFSAGDNVRGFQGAVGNVLIDGQRPSSKSVTLETLLNRINADEVQRIDLIRGGAPGIDMQGLPVLANVIRKPSGGLSGVIEGGAKAYSHHGWKPLGRVQVTRKLGAFTFDGTVNLELAKSDYDLLDGVQIRRNGAGQITNYGRVSVDMDDHLYQANGSIEYRKPKDLFHLNLGVERQNQPRREYSDLFTAAGVAADEFLFQDTKNDKAEVGGDYERQLGRGITAQLVGLYTYKEAGQTSAVVTPAGSTVSTRDQSSTESILRGSFQGLNWHGVAFAAGLEGAYNTLESASGLISNGRVQVLPSANLRVEEKRAEGFVTLSNRPTKTTSLELGVRVETSTITQSGDVDRSRSFTFPKPRLIATWAPDKSSQIRVRVERVVGQLNFQDFAASSDLFNGAAAGNSDLQPERAWIFEGAAEKRFWGQGALIFTYTHREIQQVNDRVPVYTPTSVFDAPGNIPTGTRDELKLNFVLPMERLGVPRTQFRLDFNYRMSSTLDPVTLTPRQIGGFRHYLVNATFIHDVPKWRSTFTIQAQPAGYKFRTYRLTQLQRDARPVIFRFFWNWTISKDWLFRTEVYNLLPKLTTRTRDNYTPTRAGTLVSSEHRRLWADPVFTFKLRRSF